YPADNPSLGEQLMTSAAGGIMALWAPTSVAYEIFGFEIAEYFFEDVFQQKEVRLGDSIKYTLENFDSSSVFGFLVKTFELQGDPATIMAPGTYSSDSWLEQQFTADDLTNSIISDWDADPDGDGISNLEEYNAGTSPTNYNAREQFTGGMASYEYGGETNSYISVSFPQVKWSTDVKNYIEMRYDLMAGDWFDATAYFEQGDEVELNDQAERVTLHLVNTNMVEREVFIRTRTALY
ncbi:MAG: hypothetical protein KAI74_01540, partial [Kiritimatiellae bacterium]|nr:hypothetical protein [Kiritimatiellia bacterium]